jgi:hypothetical protein
MNAMAIVAQFGIHAEETAVRQFEFESLFCLLLDCSPAPLLYFSQ